MASQDSKPLDWNFSDFNHSLFKFQRQSLILLVIFFTLIILMISLIYLYARWVCRRRHSEATIFSSELSGTGVMVRSLGLDAAAICSLPISLHRPLAASGTVNVVMEEETECSICLTLFQSEEKVKVLPKCHHTYHPDCVDKWLSTQSSCPLCRASLRVDSPP